MVGLDVYRNLAPIGVWTPDFQPVANRYIDYDIPAAILHTVW
jgi:hypothetical protein